MKILLLVVVVLCLVAGFIKWGRYIKTGYLIFTTQPFERDLGPAAKGRILVAGDSTAYGTGVSDPRYSIAGRLGSDFPEYSVQTISENGATTVRLRELLSEEKLAASYDFILFQIGANDILQGRDNVAIEKDLRELLVLAKTRSSFVFVMTSGNVGAAQAYTIGGIPDQRLEAKTREVRTIFMRTAYDMSVVYVDLFEETDIDVFLKDPETFISLDGLHPNAAGYGQWYGKLRVELEVAGLL